MHGMHAEFIFSADGISVLSPQKIIVPGLASLDGELFAKNGF